MSPKQYARFNLFQLIFFKQMDGHPATDIHFDTPFGNELFQRMSDAAFLVFEKYDEPEGEPKEGALKSA